MILRIRSTPINAKNRMKITPAHAGIKLTKAANNSVKAGIYINPHKSLNKAINKAAERANPKRAPIGCGKASVQSQRVNEANFSITL